MLIMLKKNAIHNTASANEKISLNSSIMSDNAPENSENFPIINWDDFNLNGNKIKNSAEIFGNISFCLSRSINTPSLVKHGQSNTELQALKNVVLKLEAQMFYCPFGSSI